MTKILSIIGLIGTIALTSQSALAANRPEILKIINSRFEAAAKLFNGNETGEVKTLNSGNNRDTSDAPRADNSFMKPSNDANEMICYRSDTGKIVVAYSPDKLGTDFSKELANQINTLLQTDADGKVEIAHTISIKDPNDATKEIKESMITVAWGKDALTGKNDSKLICTITAPSPAA